MGYNTAATEWPSTSPSPQIKALIDQFFLLLDSDSLDTGDRLAETIFMPDGTMVGPGGAAEGSEGVCVLSFTHDASLSPDRSVQIFFFF